ncbi:unnamed protein product [Danaus chrysippus]|uniref:(African queen) hypothetical protein n=1 Tax=Danaus chrysippus TaxID=151541 RepID=A0A8J2R3L0_9NEOP|nr:unnamed protein product [Danaus chrysippus]
MFEENEELLHLFEKFRELRTKEAIVSFAELAEHATQVMHTLDEGIKGLADMDSFFTYVRHKIKQPFLEAAKTTLGERYTPNIENIYKLTIRFILENLVKGYEEAGEENGTTQT